MKVSREQLQKIIQEELKNLVKQEELDEGFLDKLFGRSKDYEKLVSDEDMETEIKNNIEELQKTLGKLYNLASMQQNRTLSNSVRDVSDQVGGLLSFTTAPSRDLNLVGKDITLKNAKENPKLLSKAPTDRLVGLLKKMSPDTPAPTKTDNEIDRQELIKLVKRKLFDLPDISDFTGDKTKFSSAARPDLRGFREED